MRVQALTTQIILARMAPAQLVVLIEKQARECTVLYDAFSVRRKKLEPERACTVCTCGERSKHFIEDMNFETRLRCGSLSTIKTTKRGSRTNCQRWGALVCIDHFQVFCKDYSHHWNTNPRWFPPRQEWWPCGPLGEYHPTLWLIVSSGENHPTLWLVWVRLKITPHCG